MSLYMLFKENLFSKYNVFYKKNCILPSFKNNCEYAMLFLHTPSPQFSPSRTLTPSSIILHHCPGLPSLFVPVIKEIKLKNREREIES